jgi:hypothetical protein
VLSPSDPNPRQAASHPVLQDIWLVKADGTELKRLADLAEDRPSLVWEHDGMFLYVMGATGFWKIRVENGQRDLIGDGIFQGQVEIVPR